MKSALTVASLLVFSVTAPLSGARHNRLVRAEPGVDSTVAKLSIAGPSLVQGAA